MWCLLVHNKNEHFFLEKFMKILVACEESQRVCLSFRNKGHLAFSCDIKPCTGGFPGYHIQDDCLKYINGNCSFLTADGLEHYIDKWDMLIAFPPCTYFSRVNSFNYFKKTGFNYKRFNDSKPYVDLFLKLYNAPIKYICIENPKPIYLFDDILPKPTMYFQPYEFGEPYTKLTCLWLKNLPYLMPTLLCMHHSPYVIINDDRFSNKSERSTYRSKTFPGVAYAMAEQWNFSI